MTVEKIVIEANDTNYLIPAILVFISVCMVLRIFDWIYQGKRKKRLERLAYLIKERHTKIEVENEYRLHLKNELERKKRLEERQG